MLLGKYSQNRLFLFDWTQSFISFFVIAKIRKRQIFVSSHFHCSVNYKVFIERVRQDDIENVLLLCSIAHGLHNHRCRENFMYIVFY